MQALLACTGHPELNPKPSFPGLRVSVSGFSTLTQAFYLARTGRPGPVLVDVPKDIQQQLAVPDWDAPMAISGYMSRQPPAPQASQVQAVLQALNEVCPAPPGLRTFSADPPASGAARRARHFRHTASSTVLRRRADARGENF